MEIRCSPLVSSSALVRIVSIILAIQCCLSQLGFSATDTLFQGQSITGNQTLVSAGNVFELGFFSPGVGTGRYYLGIWYYNIFPQTVVWIANRESPFPDTSGIITVRFDRNLVVMDARNRSALWSTNSSTSVGNSSVTIRDNGDLVLQSGGMLIWESFTHPTDTFLPQMTLTLNKSTGLTTTIRSWRSPDDPAPGNYSLALDSRGTFQLLILGGNKTTTAGNGSIWWRSGPWTSAKVFNGVSRLPPLSIFGFNLVPVLDNAFNLVGINFGFNPLERGLKLRFVLLPNGTETAYEFNGMNWVFNWSQPAKTCEFYNKCGANAICREDSTPLCSCLDGFEPKSSDEWSAGNWTGGCMRRTPLVCGQNEAGFMSFDNIKLPDFAVMSLLPDNNNCSAACMSNCSCMAYSYLDQQGCFTWAGDMPDIFQFNDDNGNNFNLKLPVSELNQPSPAPPGGGGRSSRWKTVVVAVPVVVGSIVLISLCLCFTFMSRLRGLWKTKTSAREYAETMPTSSEGRQDYSSVVDLNDELHSERKTAELPLISFETIQSATDNFSETNTLGKGGFGHVYKGVMPGEGLVVAVKRLSRNSFQGLEEFKNEMILIAKLQHNNLVRLLGCCIQGDEKILLYEYMPNKSLDAFIFNPTKQPLLDWKKRFHIIEGIARGLLYLHRDSRLRIIHRDLKASNILLDEEMNPKISDFGMARIFGGDQHQDNTTRVVGTFGYMSPEYAMEGLFSVKSDVYSYGVLILEIVSGCKNNRLRSDDFANLLGYAWQLWSKDKAMELVDPSIYNTCNAEEALRCIHVALLCVQDQTGDRPTMSDVVIMLGSETRIQAMPKKPTFAAATGNGTTVRQDDDIYSSNGVTITSLTGR